MADSSISKFFEKSLKERLGVVADFSGLSQDELKIIEDATGGISYNQADNMIENAIGTFSLPLGIATNFRVNDKDYLIPMVIEEPSVIAAASKAAKIARIHGGFKAKSEQSYSIGQIQIVSQNAPTYLGNIKERIFVKNAMPKVIGASTEILNLANSKSNTLPKMGKGAKEVSCRELETDSGSMLIVELLIDVGDAMGANVTNTMCEAVAPMIEELTGGRALLRILSNYSTKRMASASAVFDKDAVGGENVVDDIIMAFQFAENDPYRAVTHNKGVMNGIISVANATGQDSRAIEAAITSYLLSKIDIYVDYTQLKQDLSINYKLDGNFFYLKNQLGGNEKILVGKDLSKDDLSKINLTGQDLSGANLSGQDLRYVDLTDTLLRSANLSFTNLSGQDLSGKDLTGVNFHGANLENANLSDMTTTRKVQVWLAPGEQCPSLGQSLTQELNTLYSVHKCSEKIIQNEKIRTDFSDTNLKGVTMNFSEYRYLHHIDFSGADLTGIELSQIGFRNCNFSGAKLNDSRMSEAIFFYVDFINAEMKNSQFTGMPFFQNVSFHNAKIINGYFEKPVFIDTDFSNANLMNTIIDEPTMAGDINNKCKNNQICE